MGEGKGANWLRFLLIFPSGETTHRFVSQQVFQLGVAGYARRGGGSEEDGSDLPSGRTSTLSPDAPAAPGLWFTGQGKGARKMGLHYQSPATRAPSLSH